jgi:hypothetical protein
MKIAGIGERAIRTRIAYGKDNGSADTSCSACYDCNLIGK